MTYRGTVRAGGQGPSPRGLDGTAPGRDLVADLEEDLDDGPAIGRPYLVLLAMVAGMLALTVGLLWLFARPDPNEVAARAVASASSPVTEIPLADRGEPVEIVGTDLEGEPLALTDYRGQVVVVNVWGSWCVPCREEAPVLARLSAEYASQGISFVGIDVRDNIDAARAFEARYGITYPSVDDPQARTLLAFQGTIPMQAVPSTVVLDRQGRPASRIIGLLQESTLRTLMDTALGEPAPAGA